MNKYSFNWRKFWGFSLIAGPILWGQYMILGSIERLGEESGWFAYVPNSAPLMLTFLVLGFIGCALLSIEVKEV